LQKGLVRSLRAPSTCTKTLQDSLSRVSSPRLIHDPLKNFC
jgi:hypothetical protein